MRAPSGAVVGRQRAWTWCDLQVRAARSRTAAAGDAGGRCDARVRSRTGIRVRRAAVIRVRDLRRVTRVRDQRRRPDDATGRHGPHRQVGNLDVGVTRADGSCRAAALCDWKAPCWTCTIAIPGCTCQQESKSSAIVRTMRKCGPFASLITCWETSAGSATAANTPAPTAVDASVTIARFDLKRRTFCLLPKGTARCDPTAPRR